MKELIISPSQDGQKLERVLTRYLKNAPVSFLYRMLRRKNITLNGKKATGKERIHAGDAVQVWFSEETFLKFAGEQPGIHSMAESRKEHAGIHAREMDLENSILYEDRHVLIVNKPAGILTQKAVMEDYSLNEYAVDYLLRTGQTDPESLVFIRPSACNRLDRNTSGVVMVGKTQQGLSVLTELLRERLIHKDYLCLALGKIDREMMLTGYLAKDHEHNKVEVAQEQLRDGKEIRTRIRPVEYFTDPGGYPVSLLEIRLFTGRTHQIRAHLAGAGCPIIGDAKYGDRDANRYFRDTYAVRSQLLHAYSLEFPAQVREPLQELSGKKITAQPPEVFRRVCRAGETECQIRKQED